MPGLGKSRQKISTIPLNALNERYKDADNLLTVYLDICRCLSGRCGETDWGNYTDADWRLFENIVLQEGVAALINSKKPELKTLLEKIPINIWLKFSEFRMRVKYTNDLRFKELSDRVFPAIFPDFGPIVFLKGSSLSLSLYKDISLRSMSDFDLLVKDKATAYDIFNALSDLGYKKVHAYKVSDNDYFYDKDLALEISSPFKFMIEFHWNPLDNHLTYGSNIPNWFKNQIIPLEHNEITGDNASLYRLSPTADFILQILHCYLEHGVQTMSLFHIFETFFLVEKWGNLINWDEVNKILTDNGWMPVLKLASDCIEERFGKALPENIRIEDIELGFMKGSQGKSFRTHAPQYLFQLKNLSPGMMLKAFFNIVFPPPSYMKDRYGKEKSGNLLYLYLKRLSAGFSDLPGIIRALWM